MAFLAIPDTPYVRKSIRKCARAALLLLNLHIHAYCTCLTLISAFAVDTSLPPAPSVTSSITCDPEVTFTCSLEPLECIPKDLVCNGVSECVNGLDESVTMCGRWLSRSKAMILLLLFCSLFVVAHIRDGMRVSSRGGGMGAGSLCNESQSNIVP